MTHSILVASDWSAPREAYQVESLGFLSAGSDATFYPLSEVLQSTPLKASVALRAWRRDEAAYVRDVLPLRRTAIWRRGTVVSTQGEHAVVRFDDDGLEWRPRAEETSRVRVCQLHVLPAVGASTPREATLWAQVQQTSFWVAQFLGVPDTAPQVAALSDVSVRDRVHVVEERLLHQQAEVDPLRRPTYTTSGTAAALALGLLSPPSSSSSPPACGWKAPFRDRPDITLIYTPASVDKGRPDLLQQLAHVFDTHPLTPTTMRCNALLTFANTDDSGELSASQSTWLESKRNQMREMVSSDGGTVYSQATVHMTLHDGTTRSFTVPYDTPQTLRLDLDNGLPYLFDRVTQDPRHGVPLTSVRSMHVSY